MMGSSVPLPVPLGPAQARRPRRVVLPLAVALVCLLAVAMAVQAFAAPSGGRRYYLVTGSARGIGQAVCEALAKASTAEAPITVIASGRSAESVEAAAQAILENLPESRGASLEVLELDVADEASRAEAVAKLKGLLGEGGSLAAIVNNAGVACDMPWAPTPPGVSYGDMTQRVLDTNLVGPVALTETLIKEGLLAGGRVISVSSGGGHIAINKVFPSVRDRFLAPELSTKEVVEAAEEFVQDARSGGQELLEQKWNYTHRYGFSKLCLSAASRTLAREHPDIIIHACTPGFVLTGMTVGSPATLTPAEGAVPIVHLATSTDPAVLESGKFFNNELEVLSWDDSRYVK